jgi:type IV secretory pathway TraG/TraD family ATPase VirD4
MTVSFAQSYQFSKITTLDATEPKKVDSVYQTLPNVAHLLDYLASESSRGYVDALFADKADDWLFAKYNSLISQSDNALSGVISSCQTSVQLFDLDDDIRQIVSSDSIGNFAQLRKEPTTLYLISSTVKMEYYAPLMSLFLEQYFESFFAELPTDEEYDVYFQLDEAPVLKLDNLDTICANVRKHRGNICCVGQDPYSQFARIYGNDARDSILANLKTKVYFSTTLEQAKRLEQIMGSFEFQDDYNESKRTVRSLMTVDEILTIPENKLLIHVSGKRPMVTRFKPYFKEPKYKRLSELPPYKIEQTNHSTVQLLPLKEMYPQNDAS